MAFRAPADIVPHVTDALLAPLAQPPTVTLDMLVLGSAGCGKSVIGKALMAAAGRFARNVRLSSEPRLPDSGLRPRLDFVVLLVQMTSTESWAVVRNALEFIGQDYLLGRLAFCVTRAEDPAVHALPLDDVEAVAEELSAPVVFCDVEDARSMRAAANRLIRCAELAHGGTPSLTPLAAQALLQ